MRIWRRALAILFFGVIICNTVAVRVKASFIGTAVLFHSNDEWSGDASFIHGIGTSLSNVNFNVIEAQRPSTIYAFNTNLQSSDVFYLRCHGLASGGVIQLSSGVNYNSGNLPASLSNDIVFISICYGAKNNATYGNLCSNMVTAGAGTVFSYSDTVYVAEARYLEQQFFTQAIDNHRNMLVSYSLARNATASYYGINSTAQSSFCMYGNSSAYIY